MKVATITSWGPQVFEVASLKTLLAARAEYQRRRNDPVECEIPPVIVKEVSGRYGLDERNGPHLVTARISGYETPSGVWADWRFDG